LNTFGIAGDEFSKIGSIPLLSFILPIVRMSLFITAFAIMIHKQYRQNKP
jgi:hypothetical protein